MRMSPYGWAVPIVSLSAILVLAGTSVASATDLGQDSHHHVTIQAGRTGQPDRVFGPVTYPGLLESVSAVSASDAWAVGFSDDGNEHTSTLVEHWNGHFWSLVTSPQLGGNGGSELYGVSVVSANDVWAVGNIYSGTEFDTLIEHWDGTSWTQVPSPSPGGSTGSYLEGVSARSATDAWAVGRTYAGPLIEHWDGTSWTQVASPGGAGTELTGVSAVAATTAFAVGQTFGAFSRPFIVRWDGTSWTRSAAPGEDKRGHGDVLNGVSALSGTDAWAVGTTTTYRRVVDRSLIEHWDGTDWQVAQGLDPGGRFGTQLAGVSAAAPDDVWAVGSYGFEHSGGLRTFIEHWDGTQWRRTHTASPGGHGESVVSGIDALNGSRAFAAGSYVQGNYQTMTQNWDGRSWIQL